MITAGQFVVRGSVRALRQELRCGLLLLLLGWCLPVRGFGQAKDSSPSSPSASSATTSAPEITSHEETPTFKVKVNLVQVRVVVRDARGQPIGNLKQEDFQLFDNGKPQVITRFSVEKAGTPPVIHNEGAGNEKPGNPAEASTASAAKIPQRYIAYLFDDVHLEQNDLATARNAAKRQLATMAETDRAAIFTTSGQTRLDFTDDRAQLTAALDKIISRPLVRTAVVSCPKITYYMADLIQNKHDERAIVMATKDALECAYFNDPNMYRQAQQLAYSMALQELTRNNDETRLSFSVLKDVIRRVEDMPGERTIVLVSPGFLNPDDSAEQLRLTDLALHAKVVINTLDARGVYVPLPDIDDTRTPGAAVSGTEQEYLSEELAADDEILAEFAYDTGGTFFHNNNDLAAGFRDLVSPPEYSYVLAFSPQNLKLNGQYHTLKVTLKPPTHGTVRARKGYFAPKGPADASEQAKQDIEDAVFSREEMRDIPIELHTQFFKPDQDDAKLSVVARVDIRHLHFEKTNGRNNTDMTVVSALFDRNGNFVSGNQKLVQLHLKDDTMDRLSSGMTLKSSFDVKPGSYIVRLVVRDKDGQLAAENSAVEIP